MEENVLILEKERLNRVDTILVSQPEPRDENSLIFN